MKELFNKRQDIFKGYDFKSHDFRHTIATLLYDDEVPLRVSGTIWDMIMKR